MSQSLSSMIRSKFIKYFKTKGHAEVASSPTIPHDDPTLLFINAGMNQFKDVFLGKSGREYTRAVTTQKCIRVGGKHNDLENVGHTSRHLTFFEMLGNFSFGDYFKKEAIEFAWEVSTQVFELDPQRMWVSVFEEDDEAHALWSEIFKKAGLDPERIVRMGEKENFWSMGDTGPCGPCSEILYDRGPEYGNATSPLNDPKGERYPEFWNLVFMQYNKKEDGTRENLPKPSIDTGAGLERVLAFKLGAKSVFETDIFQTIIRKIEKISGKLYDKEDEKTASAFHVIADHIRALAFGIADGAVPSNTDRGYVLRKILRRAVRYGHILGLKQPFLGALMPALIEAMGEHFQEIVLHQDRICEILKVEEEQFNATLARGGNILNGVIEKAKASGNRTISGAEAFKLKDTYGLPLGEIELIAIDHNLEVDTKTFLVLEEEARERSRGARKEHSQEVKEGEFLAILEKQGATEFIGYTEWQNEEEVIAIFRNGKRVDSIEEGSEGIVILERTPFYAESGGQVGDKGVLTSYDGDLFQVSDTQNGAGNSSGNLILHHGKVSKGTLRVGDAVLAQVDADIRQRTSNNHSATHLLHLALQTVLGDHIRQAGSLVEMDKLRFDFNHHKALSRLEIREVERIVNEKIRTNKDVSCHILPYETVQKRKDVKQFFGEKYGSMVRLVDMDFSKELCGGTHTRHLGTIGLFKIVKESSIAAGVRRIEAVTGPEAIAIDFANEDLIVKVSDLLKTTPAHLNERAEEMLSNLKELEKKLKELSAHALQAKSASLSSQMTKIGDVHAIVAHVDLPISELRPLSLDLMGKHHSLALLLIAHEADPKGDKVQIVTRVSKDLQDKGISALALLNAAAPSINAKGGGRDNAAEAGGTNSSGIAQALEQGKKALQK